MQSAHSRHAFCDRYECSPAFYQFKMSQGAWQPAGKNCLCASHSGSFKTWLMVSGRTVCALDGCGPSQCHLLQTDCDVCPGWRGDFFQWWCVASAVLCSVWTSSHTKQQALNGAPVEVGEDTGVHSHQQAFLNTLPGCSVQDKKFFCSLCPTVYFLYFRRAWYFV